MSCIIKLVFLALFFFCCFYQHWNWKGLCRSTSSCKGKSHIPPKSFLSTHHSNLNNKQCHCVISTVKYFIFNNQTFPIIMTSSMVDHPYNSLCIQGICFSFNLAVIILVQISLLFFIFKSRFIIIVTSCVSPTTPIQPAMPSQRYSSKKNYESTALQCNVVCRAMSNHAFLAFTFLLA